MLKKLSVKILCYDLFRALSVTVIVGENKIVGPVRIFNEAVCI